MNCPPEAYDRTKYFGFFKVWKSDPKTGKSEILVDKRNTVLNTGADLLALALSGRPNAKISHMYLEYTNETPGAVPTVTATDTTFPISPIAGYIRSPLTFPAVFTTEENYENNIVVFTVMLSSTAGLVAGDPVQEPLTSALSSITGAGLVAALDPSGTSASHPSDKAFARIAFEPIVYDADFNLTISWGVRFVA